MEIKQGSIIAYRQWAAGLEKHTNLPVLFPPNISTMSKWGYNITEAKCPWCSMSHHIIPDWSCTCGLYGLKDLPNIKNDTYIRDIKESREVFFRGEVELFGKIIYHEAGYRAQYGRVHSLSPLNICIGCLLAKNRTTVLDLDHEGWILFSPRIRYITPIWLLLCDSCLDDYKSDPSFWTFLKDTFIYERYAAGRKKPSAMYAPLLFNTLCDLYCDGRRMLDIALQRIA